MQAHTFDVTRCAQGLGVRHTTLTPVGGSEIVFEKKLCSSRVGVWAAAALGGVDGVLRRMIKFKNAADLGPRACLDIQGVPSLAAAFAFDTLTAVKQARALDRSNFC